MKNLIKKILLLIFIISLMEACYKSNQNFSTSCNAILVNAPVDSLLKSFIKENDSIVCQYYLITYLSCNQRIVTFIANNVGEKYYLKKKSLTYIIEDGKKINLITGVEDFFKKVIEKEEEKGIKELGKKSPFFNIKSYIIEKDKIELVPQGIPPFAPPPNFITQSDSLK